MRMKKWQLFTVPILHGYETGVSGKMDALVREFPDVFRIKRWTEVSKTYEMPKKYVRIGKPRELSSAQRENLEKMRGIKKQVQNDCKTVTLSEE